MEQTILLRSKIIIEENFDPENIDVTFVTNFISRWPKSGVVDEGVAKGFLAESSHILSQLIDLYAKCEKYELLADKWVKAELARAAINSTETTQSAKEKAALVNETYLGAVARHASAKGSLTWMKEHLEEVRKIHYVCKDLVKAHQQVTPTAGDGWEGG